MKQRPRHLVNIRSMLAACLLAVTPVCHAYDGLSSELTHFAGGGVLAGGITAMFDSPYRAWYGFGISTALIVISENRQMRVSGAPSHSSHLDIGWHAAGSALGAWMTDKYILSPVLAKGYAGVQVAMPF